MRLVYAAANTLVASEGQRVLLRPGEVWAADDPVVARYPDLFTEHPQAVRTTTTPQGWRAYEDDVAEGGAGDEPPVETTRQRPGERRPTKRPSKAAAAQKRAAK